MPNPDAFDPTLIVFALLAIFVIWKLRSVLGVRVDRETPEPGGFPAPGATFQRRGALFPDMAEPAPATSADDQRWRGLAAPGGPAWAGLNAIAANDPRFTAEGFADGARRAYEAIVAAFARGDRDALRNLLSQEVFDNFDSVIKAREARGETAETRVVAIDGVTVEEARVERGANFVTLRYDSRLLSAVRDAKGAIVSGGLDSPVVTIDLWTFARDPRSPDPNWKLVATASGQ